MLIFYLLNKETADYDFIMNTHFATSGKDSNKLKCFLGEDFSKHKLELQ